LKINDFQVKRSLPGANARALRSPPRKALASSPAMLTFSDQSANLPATTRGGGSLAVRKVVARYLTGETIKGTTSDFKPHRDTFTIEENLPDGSSRYGTIRLEELKAVFFVHSLEGDRNYSERKLQIPRNKVGKRLLVTFTDGEAMRGTSVGTGLLGGGFLLFPADPRSNNKRIFVVRTAVKEIREEK